MQSLQALQFLRRVAGKGEGDIHAVGIERGPDCQIPRQLQMVANRPIDAGLTNPRKPHGEGMADLAQPETIRQVRHQLVSDHGSKLARWPRQRRNHSLAVVENQPHGGSVGIGQVGPLLGGQRLPAQNGPQDSLHPAISTLEIGQGPGVLLEGDPGIVGEHLASDVLAGGTQTTGGQNQGSLPAGEIQGLVQVGLNISNAHRTQAAVSQGTQGPGDELGVLIGVDAPEQLAAGHDYEVVQTLPAFPGGRGPTGSSLGMASDTNQDKQRDPQPPPLHDSSNPWFPTDPSRSIPTVARPGRKARPPHHRR